MPSGVPELPLPNTFRLSDIRKRDSCISRMLRRCWTGWSSTLREPRGLREGDRYQAAADIAEVGEIAKRVWKRLIQPQSPPR
jgi:hypothetical protein